MEPLFYSPKGLDMNILILTIPVTLTMVLIFILLFFFAARKGQFDDLETPAHTPFLDNDKKNKQDIKTEVNNVSE